MTDNPMADQADDLRALILSVIEAQKRATPESLTLALPATCVARLNSSGKTVPRSLNDWRIRTVADALHQLLIKVLWTSLRNCARICKRIGQALFTKFA